MTYRIYYLHQPSGENKVADADAISLSEKIWKLQNDGGLIVGILNTRENQNAG